jgi:hypothetical protein
LYFTGGCSSFGSLLGMVEDLPIGANSGAVAPSDKACCSPSVIGGPGGAWASFDDLVGAGE